MEALSDILLPYKEPVSQVTRFVTIGQMFSGSFICYDIYKQGSTKGVGIMPFVGGLIIDSTTGSESRFYREEPARNLVVVLFQHQHLQSFYYLAGDESEAGCFQSTLSLRNSSNV
ncbi:jg1009 [Pararge aegeria aegeria]|uniref:Jg1009 protein n=1 Tax=Pararge aegeria aegeria TaxID=348720 RepID=A0A8S4SC80_9NEOP|nr:jg1009 [Pararge aegeria aegeria]